MRGGKRVGAGRNTLPESSKKNGYKIYLTDDEYKQVDQYGVGNSFSEKCANIIMEHVGNNVYNVNTTVKFIDLFAGIGGMRLGFEQALNKRGLATTCVFSSEIKQHAINAYQHNFGKGKVSGDITKIDPKDIPTFDILLAGFPCQPFSYAGKRHGFSDTRGTLFFNIEKILKAGKPKGFILENVEGLVSHDGGRTLSTILSHLKGIGYNVDYKVFDGKDFGLAQTRKRIYIVGSINNVEIPDSEKHYSVFKDVAEKDIDLSITPFVSSLKKHFKLTDLYGKSIKDKRGGINNIHSWDIGIKGEVSEIQSRLLESLLKERRKKKWAKEIGIDWMDGMPLTLSQIETFFQCKGLEDKLNDLVKKGYLAYEYPKQLIDGNRVEDESKPKGYNIVTGKLSFEFNKILDPEDVVPTLVATDISKLGIVDGDGVRTLTVREGLRLFGFHDKFDLSIIPKNKAFDLLGNTVCVPVIEFLSSYLADVCINDDYLEVV